MAIKVSPRRDLVKTMSRPALLGALIISMLAAVGFYAVDLRLERTEEYERIVSEDIEIVEIPPTAQEQQQQAPARPQVPIEAEDEADIEELTIEDTQLYQQATVAVPERIEDDGVVEEEPVLEFWMVEETPRALVQAVPEYPEIARQAGMEGDVFVQMVVGTDGTVESVEILRGPPVFHEAAKEAAMRMKFSPALQNDRPVRVKVSQRISFRLR